jgi:hypothetical protein
MNEYEKQANLFLLNTNTSFQYALVNVVLGFPNDDSDKEPRNHFKVLLKNSKGEITLDYYGSINDYRQGNETLTIYDVLSSLSYNVYQPSDSMWEFAEELGYVISTEKTFKNVQRIHKEVERQHQALVKMFTKEELEQLQDIN